MAEGGRSAAASPRSYLPQHYQEPATAVSASLGGEYANQKPSGAAAPRTSPSPSPPRFDADVAVQVATLAPFQPVSCCTVSTTPAQENLAVARVSSQPNCLSWHQTMGLPIAETGRLNRSPCAALSLQVYVTLQTRCVLTALTSPGLYGSCQRRNQHASPQASSPTHLAYRLQTRL